MFSDGTYEIMSRTILVELQLPDDWESFRMPSALHDRLQDLLQRQNQEGKLSRRERQEAEGLVELVDMLSLMRLRAERAAGRQSP